MEASASTHEQAPPVLAPAGTAVQRSSSDGRLLTMLFLGGLLGYTAIGVAVYELVAARL